MSRRPPRLPVTTSGSAPCASVGYWGGLARYLGRAPVTAWEWKGIPNKLPHRDPCRGAQGARAHRIYLIRTVPVTSTSLVTRTLRGL